MPLNKTQVATLKDSQYPVLGPIPTCEHPTENYSSITVDGTIDGSHSERYYHALSEALDRALNL